ncbi:hypothetical protein E2C01_082871 [Portunus trituberculatus]|uniref:Uncharacterized protein n=1 Tax=Portunus trituberculatus TaxID=210409 RepID=A0A5B7J0E9_PORTR|nr:hypothetical protein [Portunus trituberculatus]
MRTAFRRRYSPRSPMLIGCSMRPHSELSPSRVLLQARPWWSVVPDLLPPQLSGPLLLPSADLPSPLVPGTPEGAFGGSYSSRSSVQGGGRKAKPFRK